VSKIAAFGHKTEISNKVLIAFIELDNVEIQMGKQKTKKKVIVIVLDGGTFDLVDPLLEKVPGFRKIVEEGASGTLTSTIPPVTPPACASFTTGVNPGKHGVYDFLDSKGSGIIPVTSDSIRRETLWSLLSKADKKVVLINVPLTYPPGKVKGFIVTGLMTPGNIPYTYPKFFRRKLLKEIPEYRVYTRTTASVNEHLFLKEAYNLLKARRDATLYLMKNYDWDFFVSYFFYTDSIQHNFWKYMDPSHPAYNPDAPRRLKEAIAKAYKIVDDCIQRILEIIDADTILIVMSDHGFGPLYKYVYLNNYLRKVGIVRIGIEGNTRLTVNSLLKASQKKSRINTDRFPYLSKFITVINRIIFDIIFNREKVIEKSTQSRYSSRFIDWKQTKAYHAGSLRIVVNRHVIKSNLEYERLTNYLVQKLYELRDPESGVRIVDTVFKKSEIYWGPLVNRAPDLTLFMKKMTYMPHRVSEFVGSKIVEPSTHSGWHRMEGMLIMYGKDVRRGYVLKDSSIMDLAPTILYLMGLRVPSDIDGKVLVDAFIPSYVKTHPIRLEEIITTPIAQERYALSKEEEQKIKERLKALGYLG